MALSQRSMLGCTSHGASSDFTHGGDTHKRKLSSGHLSCVSAIVNHLKDGCTALNRGGNRDDLDGAKQRVCQGNNLPIYRLQRRHSHRATMWWYLPCIARNRTPRRARKQSEIQFRSVCQHSYSGPALMSPTSRQLALGRAINCCLKQRTWPRQCHRRWLRRRQSFTVILKKPNKRHKRMMGKILKAIKEPAHIAPQDPSPLIEVASSCSWPQFAGKNWYTKLGSAIPRHPAKKETVEKIQSKGSTGGYPEKARYTVSSRHHDSKE